MSYHENKFGFMVTKSALEAADLPIKTKLQVIGDNLGSTALVRIMEAMYIKHAATFIRQVNNFEVPSYHNRAGRIINNVML